MGMGSNSHHSASLKMAGLLSMASSYSDGSSSDESLSADGGYLDYDYGSSETIYFRDLLILLFTFLLSKHRFCFVAR